jgi:hypothetical protein
VDCESAEETDKTSNRFDGIGPATLMVNASVTGVQPSGKNHSRVDDDGLVAPAAPATVSAVRDAAMARLISCRLPCVESSVGKGRSVVYWVYSNTNIVLPFITRTFAYMTHALVLLLEPLVNYTALAALDSMHAFIQFSLYM